MIDWIVSSSVLIAVVLLLRLIRVQTILRFVWLSGSTLLGVWFIIANLRFAAKLRKSSVPQKTFCTLPVYVSGAVDTPCLFGLFRPAVYLTS